MRANRPAWPAPSVTDSNNRSISQVSGLFKKCPLYSKTVVKQCGNLNTLSANRDVKLCKRCTFQTGFLQDLKTGFSWSLPKVAHSPGIPKHGATKVSLPGSVQAMPSAGNPPVTFTDRPLLFTFLYGVIYRTETVINWAFLSQVCLQVLGGERKKKQLPSCGDCCHCFCHKSNALIRQFRNKGVSLGVQWECGHIAEFHATHHLIQVPCVQNTTRFLQKTHYEEVLMVFKTPTGLAFSNTFLISVLLKSKQC